MALETQLAELPDKRERVVALRLEVRPLQAQLRELRLYHAPLKGLEDEADLKAAQEEQPAEDDHIRQRRRSLEDLL